MLPSWSDSRRGNSGVQAEEEAPPLFDYSRDMLKCGNEPAISPLLFSSRLCIRLVPDCKNNEHIFYGYFGRIVGGKTWFSADLRRLRRRKTLRVL
jgi:hypothetical protein